VPARRPVARGLAAAISVALLAQTVGVALAAFGGQTSNGGNRIAAAADFRPPVVTAVAVGKSVGGATGFVKQGGGYHVYANVDADTGNPASGIASVTADVRNLTTGATTLPLVAGSYSADGVSYGYRSATTQTANAVLAEGAKEFSVTATDVAANANSSNGSASVDNTLPLAADVQTTNAGTASLAEQGDTLRLTFSEPIEPQSIQSGWNGTATNVVVRLVDAALLGLGADALQIYNAANTAALPLGEIQLGRSDYIGVGLSGNVRFGATGTPSTMTFAGNTLVVTLGTYGSTFLVDPSRTTAGGTGTMIWTPVSTPYDRAQNQLSTTAATESGAADRDF
jgi:hypothetical protein